MRKAGKDSQSDQTVKDLVSNAKRTGESGLELNALRSQERTPGRGMV